jgi:hypothetical protein
MKTENRPGHSPRQTIQCPACNGMALNRRNQKCLHCGAVLLFMGERCATGTVGFCFSPNSQRWEPIAGLPEATC